jgi:hypothetical protein
VEPLRRLLERFQTKLVGIKVLRAIEVSRCVAARDQRTFRMSLRPYG